MIARQDIIDQARTWLGVRYSPGGRARSGVSCEGLLVAIAAELGSELDQPAFSAYAVPRPGMVASAMAALGARRSLPERPGDIVGIQTTTGRRWAWVHHLGLLVAPGWAVHVDELHGVVETPVEVSVSYLFPGVED